MNELDTDRSEKEPYEFSYCFSMELKFGFIALSLLFLGCFVSAVIDPMTYSSTVFNLDQFILSLPVISSLWIVFCQYKPSRFTIHEEYIDAPSSFFSPFENIRIGFHKIESLRISNESNQTVLILQSEKEKITMSFDFFNDTEQDCILDKLTMKLNHLKSSAIVISELRERILIKRSRKAESVFLSVFVFSSLASMIIASGFREYYERQPSSDFLLITSIMISIGLAFILKRRYGGRAQQAYKFFLFFVMLSSFGPTSVLSFINQVSDNSSVDRRVASVVMDVDESKWMNDTCFYVNDELIKDEAGLRACTKENPTLNETSIVEIHYKEGNLGEPWVVSLQIIDASGAKPIQISR